MKTDATFATTGSERAEVRGALVPGHRWLADLERAWLETWPVPPERAPATGMAPAVPPGEQDVPVHSVQAGAKATSVAPASSAPFGRPSDSAVRTSSAVMPQKSHETTMTALANGDGRATIASSVPGLLTNLALAAQSAEAIPLFLDAKADAVAAMRESATPTPGSISLSTLGRATRATTLDAATHGEGAVAEPARELPLEAQTYGRRLLQVAGSDELQINLRDAALTASQQEAVARALFAEVGATGAAVRRLYLNGQRYEAWSEPTLASDATDGCASRLALPANPLRSTSILNDKE